MAGKETRTNTTRQRRKSTSGQSSRRKASSKKKSQQPPLAFELSLRPEHQRELFALALITIAFITIIFFLTGSAGGIGSMYVLGMQRLFGSGALVVPLALGVLGAAVLIQERLRDTPFNGANILGILMVLTGLQTILEFPLHHLPLDARFGEGGGLTGYWLVNMFDAAIGRPATVFVFLILTLTGFLLTFNVTLRELVTGTVNGLNYLLTLAFRGTTEPEPQTESTRNPSASRKKSSKPKEQEQEKEHNSLVFEAPPQAVDADMRPTPIAARLTNASFYPRSADEPQAKPQPQQQKPQEQEQVAPPTNSPPEEAAAPTSAKPTKAAKSKKTPEPTAPASDTPDQAVDTPAQADTEAATAQQETLDSLNQPAIYRAWPLPSIELLDRATETGKSNDEEMDRSIQARSLLIEETLHSFKVEAQVVGVNPGPAVTQFELQPAVGVKISKITSLEKDLALALAAPSIRIEAPIPGKSAVGIEIPNTAIAMVSLREVIDSEEFDASKGKLKLPLGKDIGGNPVVTDMTRMPHLLVAGSTGSGKSVAINSFLCGLLLKHTPEELKLIMVDPKMVELIVYNRIPHLLSPVVTELERVVPTLRWATREMERRYKIFARHGCRNIDSYRTLGQRRADLEPMPFIMIVIDELADLMMMAPDEVETHICRLAQMARATGIHLIIATQRPSVDVITGLIKANFPSRIAFAVSSQTDSRVILDTAGADRLLGRGDMLFMASDAAKLVRIQGTYVSDREVEEIVEFWRKAKPPEEEQEDTDQQRARTVQQAEYEARNQEQARKKAASRQREQEEADEESSTVAAAAEPGDIGMAYRPPDAFLSSDEQDELLPQALTLVRQHTRASASLLQRRLRIGYSKAAQLIDLLEQQGVVGPAEGGRSREVLQRDETSS